MITQKEVKGTLIAVAFIFCLSLLSTAIIYFSDWLVSSIGTSSEYLYAFVGGIIPWVLFIGYAVLRKKNFKLIINNHTSEVNKQ